MKPVRFDTLKVGDTFSLSDPTLLCLENGVVPYVNIKVAPSIFAEDSGKEQVKFKPDGSPDYSEGYGNILPFNTVALEDGRVRTFFPTNLVYPVVAKGFAPNITD